MLMDDGKVGIGPQRRLLRRDLQNPKERQDGSGRGGVSVLRKILPDRLNTLVQMVGLLPMLRCAGIGLHAVQEEIGVPVDMDAGAALDARAMGVRERSRRLHEQQKNDQQQTEGRKTHGLNISGFPAKLKREDALSRRRGACRAPRPRPA